ncbi:fms-related tyrosine kinase 3 ligand isoform X5 [Lemur catta]|uniref:fms-related tyrosine kinase 3 ligand isoform X5 n=1 Tax=Lemur catta TaxID=9447 RepID=UPI001E26BE97|nr:fms-related tyrosine kinase 3 ligand isoform X5 [Lemur catta]
MKRTGRRWRGNRPVNTEDRAGKMGRGLAEQDEKRRRWSRDREEQGDPPAAAAAAQPRPPRDPALLLRTQPHLLQLRCHHPQAGGAVRGTLAPGPGAALDGTAQDCGWVPDARPAGGCQHRDSLCHLMYLSAPPQLSSLRPDQHLLPPAGHLPAAGGSEALDHPPEFLAVSGAPLSARPLHPAAPTESWRLGGHSPASAPATSAAAAAVAAAPASGPGAASRCLLPALAKDEAEDALPWGTAP